MDNIKTCTQIENFFTKKYNPPQVLVLVEDPWIDSLYRPKTELDNILYRSIMKSNKGQVKKLKNLPKNIFFSSKIINISSNIISYHQINKFLPPKLDIFTAKKKHH